MPSTWSHSLKIFLLLKSFWKYWWWFLLPFVLYICLLHHSLLSGDNRGGTYRASADSHAFRNQYVWRSYEYFIDNTDEIVFAILKYGCLDAIQKLSRMTQSNLFVQTHFDTGQVLLDIDQCWSPNLNTEQSPEPTECFSREMKMFLVRNSVSLPPRLPSCYELWILRLHQ